MPVPMEDSRQLLPSAVLLILLGTVFFATPAHTAYILMGVYTSNQAAQDACTAHRNHPASNEYCQLAINTLDGTVDACVDQEILYHTGDNGDYGVPAIFPDRYGFVSTQDCGSTCPEGYTEQPTGECFENQQCPVGDEQRFHATAGEPIPEMVCSNGCWYEREFDDLPLTFIMAGQSWSGNFVSTGNACAPAGGPGGPPDNPPTNCISDAFGNTFCAGLGPGNAPPNCMEDSSGNQACLDAYDPMNCGYINGEKVCFDDYPDEGVCHFLPGGSYICFSGDEEPQSPPYPDTGTPGEPAEPDVQMQKGDGQGGPGHSLDYFNSDTVNQSSGEGGAPGPNSDKSIPDQVELEGPVEVELNEPVKIDEEGTPQQSATDQTIFDDIFNQTGINALESEIADIGTGTVSPIPDVPTTLSDIDELFPAPQSCADPQLNFFGATMVIPFASMGQGLRDVLGWAFYIMTGLYLFGLVMSLPSKVK